MTIYVDNLTNDPNVPSSSQLTDWVSFILSNMQQSAAVGVRVVDVDSMTKMNQNYRHKDGPTNVLTFVTELPEEIDLDAIHADIILCANIINKEADEQNKTQLAHWAHMVVHGVLHALGYDHIDEDEADRMESLEKELLLKMGFEDPYKGAD